MGFNREGYLVKKLPTKRRSVDVVSLLTELLILQTDALAAEVAGTIHMSYPDSDPADIEHRIFRKLEQNFRIKAEMGEAVARDKAASSKRKGRN